MKKYSSITNIPNSIGSTSLTIGTFDGMHLGHIYLIKKIIRHSMNNNNKSVLITFNPNPYIVINNKSQNEYHIISKNEKYKILDDLGVDIVFDIKFNSSISKLSADEFLKKYIINPFNPIDIIIGYDHHFGHRRIGNGEFLAKNEKRYNYKTHVIDPFKYSNTIISSSKIRELILNGNILEANKLLGRNYKIRGKVIKGKQIGRGLTFPTANIALNSISQILPSDGVYYIKAYINDLEYDGMCNIGFRPTLFNQINRSIEAHIFNYNEFDLYSQFIEIEFVDYIRSEVKFNNSDELKEQLIKDEKHCKSLINS